jgi:hypothetical protein
MAAVWREGRGKQGKQLTFAGHAFFEKLFKGLRGPRNTKRIKKASSKTGKRRRTRNSRQQNFLPPKAPTISLSRVSSFLTQKGSRLFLKKTGKDRKSFQKKEGMAMPEG